MQFLPMYWSCLCLSMIELEDTPDLLHMIALLSMLYHHFLIFFHITYLIFLGNSYAFVCSILQVLPYSQGKSRYYIVCTHFFVDVLHTIQYLDYVLVSRSTFLWKPLCDSPAAMISEIIKIILSHCIEIILDHIN